MDFQVVSWSLKLMLNSLSPYVAPISTSEGDLGLGHGVDARCQGC